MPKVLQIRGSRHVLRAVFLVGCFLPILAFGQVSNAIVPLFRTPEYRFSGPLPSGEFVFRLPEDITIESGSRLIVKFRASPLLMSDVSTATLLINDNPLTSIRLPGKPSDDGTPQTLEATLRPGDLKPGWNRVSLRALLQTTPIPCRDVDNPACWFTLEKGTGIMLAYSRRPLRPELGRFPDSLTEEQLLRQEELVDGFPGEKVRPVAALLLPGKAGDSALRGLVVAAARLGQPGYLRFESVRTGLVDEWNTESQKRNGVLFGLPADLAGADLPVDIRGGLNALKAGEGFLAETITGAVGTGQFRWIVVSGADEEGLRRAILTLGSREALDTSATNPRVIREEPSVSPFTEKLTHPFPRPQTFQILNGGTLWMRGVFRTSKSLNWYLPPGYETEAGGTLSLEVSQAGGLGRESAVQFFLNDWPLTGLPLDKTLPEPQTVPLAIPGGILGRDPSGMTVNSYLDIGTTDCSHRNEERAWVSFSGGSALDLRTRPVQIPNLSRLGSVLLRDAFLRRAAVLVPEGTNGPALGVVKDLALHLGKSLPSMPVLWPEAAFYGATRTPSAGVLKDCSVVILGSVAEWKMALPAGTALSLAAAPEKNALLLQGREVPDSALDSTLVFAQFLKSPWSAENCVVAVGGSRDLGGETAVKLLTSPEVQARLAGTVGGVDAAGRVFSYDVYAGEPQSLAERVRDQVPKGLAPEETERALGLQESVRKQLTARNLIIAGAVLALALLLLGLQVRLISRRTRRRRESGSNDSGKN